MSWSDSVPGVGHNEPWDKIARLDWQVGGQTKTIWLIYLFRNPVDAYRALFADRKIAPKFIYLRRPDNVPVQAWTHFAGDQGLLRIAVNENPDCRPQYIITEVGVGGWE